jgi:hypothetical protein
MPSETRPPSRFLHPASGVLILGLDWLLFSGSVLSLGLSTPALTGLGFVLGGVGTAVLQTGYGGDRWGKGTLKGLLGGLAVGLPLPIAGTAVGGAILALSGLDRFGGDSNRTVESPSDNAPSER